MNHHDAVARKGSARLRHLIAWELIGLALLLPIVVFVLGIWFYTQKTLTDPSQYWAPDFEAYRSAALNLLAGHSPFSAHQLAGPFSPIDAGWFNYLYAPAVAVLFVPLALIPYPAGAAIWVGGQLLAVLGASLLVARYSGRPLSPRVILALLSLDLFFWPTYHIVTGGNINGLLALLGALILTESRPNWRLGAVLLGAMTKGAHAALLPATLLRDGWRRSGGVLLILAVLVAVSLLLAPGSWLEYPRVLLNLSGGDANLPNNLAPAVVLNSWLPIMWLWRLAAVVGALALVGISAYLARRQGGWPLATLCGLCGGLLVPSTFFYPWLLLLWPFAVMVLVQPGQPFWLRAAVFVGATSLSCWEIFHWAPWLGSGQLLVWIALMAWGLRPTWQIKLRPFKTVDRI